MFSTAMCQVANVGVCDLLGMLTPFDLPDHIQSEGLYYD